ncbi:MAG: hypothetical protein IKV55_03015 [Oscillospiraceae bacterium]|nr:hypothetical protein [Oscillospiraceae bacterium]
MASLKTVSPPKLAVCAAVMLLLGLALVLSGSINNQQAIPAAATEDAAQTDIQLYEQQMEQRLTELLSAVQGAGEVQVMVTVETSESYEYASNAMQSDDYDIAPQTTRQESILEESVIIVRGENGDEALLVARHLPKIMGVAVICEGGDDIYVKQSMIEAVSILCGIPSNRISVCKKAKQPQQP